MFKLRDKKIITQIVFSLLTYETQMIKGSVKGDDDDFHSKKIKTNQLQHPRGHPNKGFLSTPAYF